MYFFFSRPKMTWCKKTRLFIRQSFCPQCCLAFLSCHSSDHIYPRYKGHHSLVPDGTSSHPAPSPSFVSLNAVMKPGGRYVWNTTLYNTVKCADGVKSSHFQALSPQRELTSVRLQTSWDSVWSALMHCHNIVRLAVDGSKRNHRALWTLTVQSADQRAVDPSLSVVSESCHSRIVNQPSHSAVRRHWRISSH